MASLVKSRAASSTPSLKNDSASSLPSQSDAKPRQPPPRPTAPSPGSVKTLKPVTAPALARTHILQTIPHPMDRRTDFAEEYIPRAIYNDSTSELVLRDKLKRATGSGRRREPSANGPDADLRRPLKKAHSYLVEEPKDPFAFENSLTVKTPPASPEKAQPLENAEPVDVTEARMVILTEHGLNILAPPRPPAIAPLPSYPIQDPSQTRAFLPGGHKALPPNFHSTQRFGSNCNAISSMSPHDVSRISIECGRLEESWKQEALECTLRYKRGPTRRPKIRRSGLSFRGRGMLEERLGLPVHDKRGRRVESLKSQEAAERRSKSGQLKQVVLGEKIRPGQKKSELELIVERLEDAPKPEAAPARGNMFSRRGSQNITSKALVASPGHSERSSLENVKTPSAPEQSSRLAVLENDVLSSHSLQASEKSASQRNSASESIGGSTQSVNRTSNNLEQKRSAGLSLSVTLEPVPQSARLLEMTDVEISSARSLNMDEHSSVIQTDAKSLTESPTNSMRSISLMVKTADKHSDAMDDDDDQPTSTRPLSIHTTAEQEEEWLAEERAKIFAAMGRVDTSEIAHQMVVPPPEPEPTISLLKKVQQSPVNAPTSAFGESIQRDAMGSKGLDRLLPGLIMAVNLPKTQSESPQSPIVPVTLVPLKAAGEPSPITETEVIAVPTTQNIAEPDESADTTEKHSFKEKIIGVFGRRNSHRSVESLGVASDLSNHNDESDRRSIKGKFIGVFNRRKSYQSVDSTGTNREHDFEDDDRVSICSRASTTADDKKHGGLHSFKEKIGGVFKRSLSIHDDDHGNHFDEHNQSASKTSLSKSTKSKSSSRSLRSLHKLGLRSKSGSADYLADDDVVAEEATEDLENASATKPILEFSDTGSDGSHKIQGVAATIFDASASNPQSNIVTPAPAVNSSTASRDGTQSILFGAPKSDGERSPNGSSDSFKIKVNLVAPSGDTSKPLELATEPVPILPITVVPSSSKRSRFEKMLDIGGDAQKTPAIVEPVESSSLIPRPNFMQRIESQRSIQVGVIMAHGSSMSIGESVVSITDDERNEPQPTTLVDQAKISKEGLNVATDVAEKDQVKGRTPEITSSSQSIAAAKPVLVPVEVSRTEELATATPKKEPEVKPNINSTAATSMGSLETTKPNQRVEPITKSQPTVASTSTDKLLPPVTKQDVPLKPTAEAAFMNAMEWTPRPADSAPLMYATPAEKERARRAEAAARPVVDDAVVAVSEPGDGSSGDAPSAKIEKVPSSLTIATKPPEPVIDLNSFSAKVMLKGVKCDLKWENFELMILEKNKPVKHFFPIELRRIIKASVDSGSDEVTLHACVTRKKGMSGSKLKKLKLQFEGGASVASKFVTVIMRNVYGTDEPDANVCREVVVLVDKFDSKEALKQIEKHMKPVWDVLDKTVQVKTVQFNEFSVSNALSSMSSTWSRVGNVVVISNDFTSRLCQALVRSSLCLKPVDLPVENDPVDAALAILKSGVGKSKVGVLHVTGFIPKREEGKLAGLFKAFK